MKHLHFHARALGLAIVLMATFVAEISAQSENANSNATKPQNAQRQVAFEQAVAAAKSRNYYEVETRLQADNSSAVNTGGWYLESGQKLAQLAGTLSNRRDRVGARETALRAVATLQTAETKLLAEGKRSGAAHAQQVIGSVQELILKDAAAAAAAYQKSVVNDPSREGGKAGVDRMKDKSQEGGK